TSRSPAWPGSRWSWPCSGRSRCGRESRPGGGTEARGCTMRTGALPIPTRANNPLAMASRLLAASLLLASALLAWLVIASSLAARVLQAVIGFSVIYVGYLAFRGWQLIRASQLIRAYLATESEHIEGSAAAPVPLPFISVVVPALNQAP